MSGGDNFLHRMMAGQASTTTMAAQLPSHAMYRRLQIVTSLSHALRPVIVYLGILVSANAQTPQLDSAAKQLQAELQAVAEAKLGTWVELPTGGWSTRHFVAELHRNESDNTVLIQHRIDYVAESTDGSASSVNTVWLNCSLGTKRVIAMRGFDMQGRQTYLTERPQAQVEPMNRPYTGTDQLICSQQYLLLDVADGYKRLGELLLLRRSLRSSRLADRPIPLP